MRGRVLTAAQRVRQKGKAAGEKNSRWLGDKVGYDAVHAWLRRHKVRTGICELCGTEPEPFRGKKVGTEFANLSGTYRRDPHDYIEVCRACHRWLDKEV